MRIEGQKEPGLLVLLVGFEHSLIQRETHGFYKSHRTQHALVDMVPVFLGTCFRHLAVLRKQEEHSQAYEPC